MQSANLATVGFVLYRLAASGVMDYAENGLTNTGNSSLAIPFCFKKRSPPHDGALLWAERMISTAVEGRRTRPITTIRTCSGELRDGVAHSVSEKIIADNWAVVSSSILKQAAQDAPHREKRHLCARSVAGVS